ncbi:MAG: hypothetical protein ABI479_11155 [Gallionella sp.]
MFIIGACTTDIGGKAKDDSQTKGVEYTVPQYSIAIVQFDDKATANVSGIGDATTTILRMQLETAGLKTILLDENSLKDAEKFKTLQPSAVVKVGADSGLDALDFRLSGAITAYSEAEEIDAADSKKKSVVARVTVDYVLADIATGKPLLTESGTGESRMTTTDALVQETSSSFDPRLREGALRDALAKVTGNVIRNLGSMPFQGKILAVDGPSLVLKAGRRSKLKEGTQLAVYHVVKALIDPDNGQVLGYRESRIGVIKIDSHQSENLSAATVVSRSGFQAGDVVKPIP